MCKCLGKKRVVWCLFVIGFGTLSQKTGEEEVFAMFLFLLHV